MTYATTYRFGPCELDEARRALTAHGQEIKLQPRVFDLLCYLVRHRERVVPKDELLDALWPGTIVVDNALQRVVSLARGALADVGLGDAVRTYPRHGYRFCIDDCREPPGCSTGEPPPTGVGVAEARAAVDRMDWVAACEAYAEADAQSPLPPDEVEAWGRAAICAGLGPSALGALERVVADRVAAGDALGAARATLLLVQIRFDHRQEAIARGLLQRAALYLDGQAPSAERGLFAWMSSRLAIFQGDADLALAHAEEACMLGRVLHDPDVECLGLVCRGHAQMLLGELDKGVAQHEEAAAMMRLGGVCAWVGGWALCSILHAARHRCDWVRAAQFLSTFTAWTSVKGMPAYPGTCRLHRAAVLGVQGDLEHAASEARAAAALLANVAPWAEGEAYCVLGDIQLSVGDFEGAEASFRQAHALGWDPQPGLARLHLLTGRAELALRGLEWALEEGDWTLRERRGLVLCLLVQAAVMAGDAERGREALRVLADDPQLIGTEALAAMHCLAEAEVAVADGDTRRATQKLRQSVRQWREVGCRVGEVEARLRLAECLLHAGDNAGAELELHTIDTHLAGTAAAHRNRLDVLRGALRPVQGTAAN